MNRYSIVISVLLVWNFQTYVNSQTLSYCPGGETVIGSTACSNSIGKIIILKPVKYVAYQAFDGDTPASPAVIDESGKSSITLEIFPELIPTTGSKDFTVRGTGQYAYGSYEDQSIKIAPGDLDASGYPNPLMWDISNKIETKSWPNPYPLGLTITDKAQWGSMWDDDYLYVAFNVWDNSGCNAHIPVSPDPAIAHQGDAVEVFLEGINRDADRKISLSCWGDPLAEKFVTIAGVEGQLEDVTLATWNQADGFSYQYVHNPFETFRQIVVRISWGFLGYASVPNTEPAGFKFDVAVDYNNDNVPFDPLVGDAREAQHTWRHVDNEYYKYDKWGTLHTMPPVCQGIIGTATINASDILVPNTVSPAFSNQRKCMNSDLVPIIFTTTGATGILNDGVAGANGLPQGVSATWLNNEITISGKPTVAGTFNYVVPLSGGCDGGYVYGRILVDPIPNPGVLNGNQAVCVGKDIQLTPTVPGGVWKSNDITIATVSNTGVVTGVSDGTTTIIYTVTGAQSCTADATLDVTVHPLPAPTFTSAPASVCANSTGHIYETESGQTGYQWSVTGGTITSGGTATDNTVTITWGATGTGHVYVNYNNVNACTAVSATDQSVTINALPTPTFITAPLSVCANSSGNIYVTESGQTDYEWSVTGGSITSGGTATDNTVTITWGTSGTGIVSVNYKNVNGCLAALPTTQNITINPLPTPSFITAPVSVCANTADVLYETQSGQTNYQWSVTGGIITAGGTTTDNSATVSWGAAGTGHVFVNYNNTNGCTAVSPADQSVTINAPPTATFIYPATPYCSNEPNPLPKLDGDADVFTSSPGLIFIDAATGQVNLSASTPGDYLITNTVAPAGGCGEAIASSYITIVAAPNAGTLLGTQTIFLGDTTTIFSDGEPGGTWISDSERIITVSNTGLVVGVGIGTANINYVVTGDGTCSDATKSLAIKVILMRIPNTISPNGDGKNDVFMEGNKVKIYNRNGLLLFTGNDGWDGTYKNKVVQSDTYYFVLEFDGYVKPKTGYVMVVR